MSFLDLLYIVLAFCILWISIGLFYLIWQVAAIVRNVNETMDVAREKITKIEFALTAIKNRFEQATSSTHLVIEGVKKLVDYVVDKKRGRSDG